MKKWWRHTETFPYLELSNLTHHTHKVILWLYEYEYDECGLIIGISYYDYDEWGLIIGISYEYDEWGLFRYLWSGRRH